MRELTMDEMEQASGGFYVSGIAAACAVGVLTSNSPTLAVMNCAGNTAAAIAITTAPLAGPLGGVALIGVGIGIGYMTHWANEYFDDRYDGSTPRPSS